MCRNSGNGPPPIQGKTSFNQSVLNGHARQTSSVNIVASFRQCEFGPTSSGDKETQNSKSFRKISRKAWSLYHFAIDLFLTVLWSARPYQRCKRIETADQRAALQVHSLTWTASVFTILAVQHILPFTLRLSVMKRSYFYHKFLYFVYVIFFT